MATYIQTQALESANKSFSVEHGHFCSFGHLKLKLPYIYRCYVDSDTTCMDARRSLRKAPFQYSCEACNHKGGRGFNLSVSYFHFFTGFQTRSGFGQSVEEHDTEGD